MQVSIIVAVALIALLAAAAQGILAYWVARRFEVGWAVTVLHIAQIGALVLFMYSIIAVLFDRYEPSTSTVIWVTAGYVAVQMAGFLVGLLRGRRRRAAAQ
jgi:hypothetical protein